MEDSIKCSSRHIKRHITICSNDSDFSYIGDNLIDGVTTIPESALLVYVWEALAMNNYTDFRNISVKFNDIYFHSQVIVRPELKIKLAIVINKGSDKFEIIKDNKLILSGIICNVKTVALKYNDEYPYDDFDDIRVNSNDVYQIFRMKGFFYKGEMKSIQSVNINKNNAYVKWTQNWVTFLDSLIQFYVFLRNSKEKPKFIREMKIDVTEHGLPRYTTISGINCYNAQVDMTSESIRCGGVEINGMIFEIISRTSQNSFNVIKQKRFFSYFSTEILDIKPCLEMMIQIASENTNLKNINIIKPTTSKNKEIFETLLNCIDIDNLQQINLNIISADIYTNSKIKLDARSTNILVFENILHDLQVITNIEHHTTPNDFILTLENELPKKSTEFKTYFDVLTCMSVKKYGIYMLLKKRDSKENVSYFKITRNMEKSFSWIPEVKKDLGMFKKVVLVSENVSHSGLLGFVKNIKRIRQQNNISLLLVEDTNAPGFDCNDDFFKDQLDKNMTVNVLKKGQWGGYYETTCDEKSSNLRSFTLQNAASRNMDDLSWVEALRCSAEKHLVQVSYAEVSLRDCCNIAYGNSCFGMDFSGIDKFGEKKMGLTSGGTVSTSIEADPDLIWPVPDNWRLEDAATVPLPYVYAYYCLAVKTQLKAKQTVLVSNGAGSLGQAVIALCLSLGCTVFTTISMKCVSLSGTFLDVNCHESAINNKFEMYFLPRCKSYINVDLSSIFKSEYANDKKILHHLLSEGISRGVVIPLARVIYSPTIVSRAFRLLSSGRNFGRVLLRLRDPVIMNHGLDVTPRLTYNPQDVVIIICDEKGLGVAIADKLIKRGATKIMLHIKPDFITGYVQAMFISWSKREVSVKLSSENLLCEQGCTTLMKNAMKFGKVREVFIVLNEKGDNGGKDDFINVYIKKCAVVLNMDLMTRKYGDVRSFTIVARVSHNASDEYAHSVLERVSEHRSEVNLPTLVIFYESLAEMNDDISSYEKLEPQTLTEFFSAMEIALKMRYKNVLTYNLKRVNGRKDFCK